MLLRELEPEKYWSFPASYSREKRQLELEHMIDTGNFFYQLKTDGNYSAFICDFDGEKRIISRGLSTVTHEYGRLEDKLFFFNDVAKAFNKPTRIMGEIWFEGGIDRHVGSVLRAATEKSLSIQSTKYYDNIKATKKFSAKDKRDIENNEFRNKQLRWRIFDVWYYDGKDLMDTPWIERQKYVKEAAERINNPLVTYVPYHPMDSDFFDRLSEIFKDGGEGVVCYREDGLPEPGKRTAHKTLKVKTEVENFIDCFITGIEPAVKNYTGKELSTWPYWEDERTGEKLFGEYYSDFRLGRAIYPISKGYYFNWPGAIFVSVYDSNGKIIPLCKVAGLTEDFKAALRDNFEEWKMCPVTIGGMMVSTAQEDNISVRHPYLKSIRKNDIDPKDCTLSKILS